MVVRRGSLQRQTLAEVIEPRYTELLNLVNEEILQLQEKLRRKGLNITWRQALY